MSFLLYDIEEYYPSISPTLLNDALDFAKKYTKITDEEIKIILQARKTFLFCNSEPWIKKDETFGNFDVMSPKVHMTRVKCVSYVACYYWRRPARLSP